MSKKRCSPGGQGRLGKTIEALVAEVAALEERAKHESPYSVPANA